MLSGIPARILDPLCLLTVLLGALLFVALRGVYRRGGRRERVAVILVWGSYAALWASATTFVGNSLLRLLEPPPTDLAAALASSSASARVLLVMGAGTQNDDAGVPPAERLSASARGRVLGAARIYHQHGFARVYVSDDAAGADAMRDGLEKLGVPASVIEMEPGATDTRSNATNFLSLLEQGGRRGAEVVVVTSAYHMKRTLRELRRAGLSPQAAPVDYHAVGQATPLGMLPSTRGAHRTGVAMHEVLGLLRP